MGKEYLINKFVKILVGDHSGEIGVIQVIYPKGLFTNKNIYQIKLSAYLSGQYTNDQFELLEEENESVPR